MGIISYHARGVQVTVVFSHKLSGVIFFNNFFLLGQKLPWCLLVNYGCVVHILPCYFDVSDQVMFSNNIYHWVKIPRWLYLSYQVCGFYISVLFSHKLLEDVSQ